jgi:hypothetical protein
MAATLRFPVIEQKVIVELEQMRRAANRILAVHPGGALTVFHGRAGMGKTTTAEWITAQINEHYDPDDSQTFRALYYEIGEIAPWSGQEQKRAIRSLYHSCIGPLDEGMYRRLPNEDLARHLVYGLMRKKIGMIFIDEAGYLSVDALRGMVLACDTAASLKWTLSICFVGMDDLPLKLQALPQIRRRVHEWCYFEEFDIKGTWKLLGKLHPHFAALDARNPEHWEQVEYIHKQFGGVIGNIAPFLQKLNHRFRDYKSEITLGHLVAVYEATDRDKELALEDARSKYQGKPPTGPTTKDGAA